MSSLEPSAWVATMTTRERVRAVVEMLDEPVTVAEVGERADVSRSTASRELERLQTESLVDLYDGTGESHVQVNLDYLLDDEVQRLIDNHDRDGLEDELQAMLDEVESLREEFGVRSADNLALDNGREARNVASTWEALESDIRLYCLALMKYDEEE